MIADFMREEILYQSEILEHCLNKPYFQNFQLMVYDEIWLIGSGDSHCASLFGSALGRIMGINTRGLTPMNASYFTNHTVTKKLLLLAISVSGKTPRVLETVEKVKKNYPEHSIIGLTDNPHSELAKIVDIPVILKTAPGEVLESSDYKDGIAKLYTGYHHDVAQTKTYFGNILAIISLFSNDFFIHNSEILQHYSRWLLQAEKLVKQHPISYPQKTIFIGSGLQESIAQFGQYKWFEYTFPGQHQDVEEYAHTSYFTTDEQTTVVFFAPTGPLLDRTLELINGALGNLIKPQMIIVTDQKVDLAYNCTIINVFETLDISAWKHSQEKELVYYLWALALVEWYTYHTARNNGFDTNQFRGGKDGEKYVRGSYYTIRKSKITD